MKCLMIETKDKRVFFTNKSNLTQLSEFIKVFKPKVFVADVKEGEILELEKLAKLLCDSEYKKQENTLFEIIKEIKPKTKINKKDKNEKIRQFIRKELISKKTVSLKRIKNKFKNYELSDSTYYNQIKIVKNELTREGFKFVRMKKKR